MFPLRRESDDRSTRFLRLLLYFVTFLLKQRNILRTWHMLLGKAKMASPGGRSQTPRGRGLTPKPLPCTFPLGYFSNASLVSPRALPLIPQPRSAHCVPSKALVTATLLQQHRFPQAQQPDKTLINHFNSATGRTRGEIQRAWSRTS